MAAKLQTALEFSNYRQTLNNQKEVLKAKTESGNFVVCIEEEYLKDENSSQEESIDVVTGSMCLFPASLLHYTIPFEAEEERIVLAFDVVPA